MGRIRMRWALATAAVLLAGCKGSPTAVDLDRLEGRWGWTAATGGFAGHTITPATQGYTMEVRFFEDGRAEVYRSDVLQNATTFVPGVGKEGGSFPGRAVLRFAEPLLGGWDEMGIELSGDNLVLADGCCDGYAYAFQRLP